MAAKKQPNKKKQNKNNKNRSVNSAVGGGRMRASRSGTGPLEGPARDWLRLLGDPCNGALTSPPYPSSDTGYLIRTVDVFNPIAISTTGLVPGSTYFVDSFVQYTPSNLSTSTSLIFCGTPNVGSASIAASGGLSNFITSSVVKRYRPVACCLKFIPSGPYSSRAGTVGVSYSPGMTVGVGDAVGSTQLIGNALHTSPTGSEPHEIKWIPTADDATWTTANGASLPTGGSVSISLRGIDAVATSTSAYVVNGYFQAITAWEWTPSAGNALGMATKAPMRTTVQAILSTIQDMGMFLTTPMGRGGMNMGMQYLTRGVNTASYRGTSLLTG